MAEHLSKPIPTLARLLREGTITAQALAEEAIDNHDRHGARLNAYKTWDAVRMRRAARAADQAAKSGAVPAALHGLPVSLKDLFGVRGYPTFAGSPRRLPEAWEREGPVVAGFRRQLAVFAGKAHTTEFALGGTGLNIHWGAPRNPWSRGEHRSPGGSSSGAGVSLGEGSCVIAMGTDTGGSVRLPASFTGTVGLKITKERWSSAGMVPLSTTFDTPGILARSVLDTAYAFAALDARLGDAERFAARLADSRLSGVRIGVARGFMWDDLDPGIGEACRRALREAERKGVRLVALDCPEYEEAYRFSTSAIIIRAEFSRFLDDELPEWWATLNPIAKRRVESTASAVEYLRQRAAMPAMNAAAEARLSGIDVLALPTTPLTPPRVDLPISVEEGMRATAKSSRLTYPVSILGLCALTVPVGLDAEGMPVGLQLVARGGGEERLLAIGAALEQVWGTPRERLGAPPRR